MVQFWYADSSDSEEDKKELTGFEYMPINVYDSIGDEDVSMVSFVII